MPKQRDEVVSCALPSREIYDSSIVIDCLNGSTLTPRVIREMKDSGVTVVNLTAVEVDHDFAEALRDLAETIETVAENSDTLMIVRVPDDIRQAKQTGRVGILLGMQDGEPIGRDLGRLETLYDAGVRVIQLTHNRQNQIGTGCAEKDSGLTKFGLSVVQEMNRLGIIVDLSHCGPQTTLDAIECSVTPVICSHSNPIAISDSRRNKSDTIIRKLAERGGIIGITGWSPIVYRDDGRRPTIDDVLDCVEHVLGLVDNRHVAIGTDICLDAQPSPEAWAQVYGSEGRDPEITGNLGSWYGFDTVLAEGLESLTDLSGLAERLLARGHDEETVTKILGLNFVTLFENVFAAAQQTSPA